MGISKPNPAGGYSSPEPCRPDCIVCASQTNAHTRAHDMKGARESVQVNVIYMLCEKYDLAHADKLREMRTGRNVFLCNAITVPPFPPNVIPTALPDLRHTPHNAPVTHTLRHSHCMHAGLALAAQKLYACKRSKHTHSIIGWRRPTCTAPGTPLVTGTPALMMSVKP